MQVCRVGGFGVNGFARDVCELQPSFVEYIVADICIYVCVYTHVQVWTKVKCIVCVYLYIQIWPIRKFDKKIITETKHIGISGCRCTCMCIYIYACRDRSICLFGVYTYSAVGTCLRKCV